MWYPFKFRGKLGYSSVGGMLGGELGYVSRSTWQRRRRWRLARREDPDFLVAVLAGCRRSVVEAWSDTPEYRFASVVVRSELDGDVSVWTETRVQPGGFRLFRVEPGEVSAELQYRSGRMIGWSADVDGRTVDVLHPAHVSLTPIDLQLVALQSVTE